jgi:uncharacterized coiled-coil protein SlyX
MPTQEERLSTLEQTVNMHGKGIDDLNHNVTILLGITSEQGKDIRAMRVSLADLSQHLDAFEQRVDSRFEALDGHVSGLDSRIGALDGRVSGLDSRIGALEQSVNSRFEEQGKKLDQVLLILNTLTSR